MSTGDEIRVQVLRSGTVREGDPNGADPTFIPNAIAQMFLHWIGPALPDIPASDVTQALVVLGADGTADVRVNDDVLYVAAAGEAAALVDPRDVFVGQILDIWPDAVDPDLAWTGFASAQGGRIVVCDFRRNRERVRALIDRAAEFHRSAGLSLAEGMLAPAVEHLCSAAEQAVMTLIQLDGWNDGRQHRKRAEWLASEVLHGNVPASFADTFDVLLADRNPARYAESPLRIDADGAQTAAGQVRAMIDFARARRE